MKKIILILMFILLASLVNGALFETNCTSLANWTTGWIGASTPYMVAGTWFNVSATGADRGNYYDFTGGNNYGVFNLTANFSLILKMRSDDQGAGVFRGDYGLNMGAAGYSDGMVIRNDNTKMTVYWEGAKVWEDAVVAWNPGPSLNHYVFDICYNCSADNKFIVKMNGTILSPNTDNAVSIPSDSTITKFGSECNMPNDYGNYCGIDWVVVVDNVEPPTPPAGTSRPVLSNYNLTSGWTGADYDNVPPYKTNDTTPSFNVVTDIGAYCAIGPSDQNFSDMGGNRNCTGGGTTSQGCTVAAGDAYDYLTTNQSAYISCINKNDETNQTGSSTSGRLDCLIYRDAIISGTVKDSASRAINNAYVSIMLNGTMDTVNYNTSTNSTGDWSIYNVAEGIYTVCAYDPSNTTLRGDCTPFISVAYI